MAVNTKSKTTLPAIPKVNVSDRNLQKFCDSVTKFCAIHMGSVGSGMDRAVTVREMVNGGFAEISSKGGGAGGGGSSIKPKPIPPGEDDNVEKPTQPKGFRVISGTTAILLIWDDVDFKGAGNTIIYRNTADDFSTAVKLVTTPAAVYSDITDNETEYWYWIRHTNENGDEGPLNSASGTKGQAGLLTTDGDGNMMIASELVAFAIYATNLTAVHIRGGDMDFAGGRFTVDVNGNCTASSLTINPGGYCRSSTYQAGAKGWAIYGDGSAEFNNITARGTFYGEDGWFKGTVYASKIIGDVVKADVLNTTNNIAPVQLPGNSYKEFVVSTTPLRSDGESPKKLIVSLPHVKSDNLYPGGSVGLIVRISGNEVYRNEVVNPSDARSFDFKGGQVIFPIEKRTGNIEIIAYIRTQTSREHSIEILEDYDVLPMYIVVPK